MITINNTQFRNLEEQVRFLSEQYNVNKGLAEWGIRIIGAVDTAEELPDAETYQGEYGDTYAVGTEAPYNFYIWTRSSIIGQGGYWFDFGNISITGPRGPVGPEGPQGEKGIRGSQWFSGGGQPDTTSGYNEGDYYINVKTGNIWHLHNQNGLLVWLMEGNILGPQGPQGPQGAIGPRGPQGPIGPQGPQGEQGRSVSILGTVTTIDQLPAPSTVPYYAAYLLTSTTPYTLYVIINDSNGTPNRWFNAGPFNAATAVIANGSFVSEFNADTKVTKQTNTTNGPIAYCADTDSNTITVPVQTGAVGDTIARRTASGQLIAADPNQPAQVATKQYVDNAAAAAVQNAWEPIASSRLFIPFNNHWYGVDYFGRQKLQSGYSSTILPSSQRLGTGPILSGAYISSDNKTGIINAEYLNLYTTRNITFTMRFEDCTVNRKEVLFEISTGATGKTLSFTIEVGSLVSGQYQHRITMRAQNGDAYTDYNLGWMTPQEMLSSHMSIIIDGTVITQVVDGVVRKSTNYGINWRNFTNANSRICIGAPTGPAAYCFEGKIRDFVVHGFALTAAQTTQLTNAIDNLW